MGKKIHIVEVGLRDGLQNESVVLDLTTRLTMAERLSEAGVKRLELGAFVSPDWVPQMANSKRLIKRAIQLRNKGRIAKDVRFSALVPNMRGMEQALEVGIEEVAVFAAASESFSKRNINCTFSESLKRFEPVAAAAQKNKVKLRAYLSTAFGCPYEGAVSEARVVKCATLLRELGAYEVSIGDTIGVANPKQVRSLIPKLVKNIPVKSLALHMHDTRGVSLANILAGMDLGVSVFDASVGGLGGCPYAAGASGNVSTEDVLNMVHGMGHKTGIDLQKMIDLNHWIEPKIQHELPSRVGKSGAFVARSGVKASD